MVPVSQSEKTVHHQGGIQLQSENIFRLCTAHAGVTSLDDQSIGGSQVQIRSRLSNRLLCEVT